MTESPPTDDEPDLIWPAREIRRFDWSKDKLTPEQERMLAIVEALPWTDPIRRQIERAMDAGLWPPAPDDQAGA